MFQMLNYCHITKQPEDLCECVLHKKAKWGTPQEVERRRRIMVSVWAYAYECRNVSLVPDHIFDAECYMLAAGLQVDTDRLDLDYWFRGAFDPSTGMWIHKHPEFDKIRQIYERWFLC